MNKIKPLYIKLRNFASFGNRETIIKFPDAGKSMLIIGSIGSGKSSIFHAMFWCVTGKKMDNNNTIINSINKKNLSVECAWSVPWQAEPLIVKRGMKPAIFEVSGFRGTIQSEIKKDFERVFPLTDTQVILNLCLLSIAKSLPFFGLEKRKRLTFLRNFIDTEKLDELTEKAKEQNLSAVNDSKIISRELVVLQNQFSKISNELDQVKAKSSNRRKELPLADREKLENALKLYENLRNRCETDRDHFNNGTTPEEDNLPEREYLHPVEFQDTKQKIDKLEFRIKELKEKVQQIDNTARSIRTRISSVEEQIDFARKDAETIQSTDCKSYFLEMIKINTDNLSKYKNDLDKLSVMRNPIDDELSEKTKNHEKYYTIINNVFIIINSFSRQLSEKIQKIQNILKTDDLNRSENVKDGANIELIASLTKLYDESEKTISAKRIELAEIDRKVLVSKEYRKILDKTWGFMTARMVPFLNSRLPYYMEKLDVNFSMHLNPVDISKPIFRGRPGISDLKLGDLSTGQKRVLSICLAHALRDMHSAQSAVDIGFLLIDELSGNMDSELVNRLMNFEFEYAVENQSSLVLVTHDIALQQRSEWDNIIKVEKDVFSSVTYLKND